MSVVTATPCFVDGHYQREAVLRTLKLLDIGLSTAVYCVAAIGCIVALSRVLGPPDPCALRRKGVAALVGRIVLRLWVSAMLGYAVRNLWQLVPMPWERVCGYEHLRVKEVINSAVFASCMISYDSHLQAEVLALKARLGILAKPSCD